MKQFFIQSKNIEKDSFLWNMIGSLLFSFQSMFVLMVLTRVAGIVEAGIFSIAIANANLFLTVGRYGMRYFQVSDVSKEYDFSEYLLSRWITWSIMIIMSIGYVWYTSCTNDYSLYKSMVIIVMCVYRSVDVIEDVYCGLYQQKGRLDVGAKMVAVRMLITIVAYCISIVIIGNQLIALIFTTCLTTALFVMFLKMTYPTQGDIKGKIRFDKVLELLKVCFPLFIGGFLSLYISNAQKYAIDAQLSDELQAYYGFIAMPVVVINLLNGLVFNPLIHKISLLWDERRLGEFKKMIWRQCGIIACITFICLAGAYVLGVPVLSVLYSTDLSDYKLELLILLVGGGFLGVSGFLNAIITIIRYQKSIVVGYAIVALLAFVLSNKVVAAYGIMGAAVLYTVLMAGLCVCFTMLLMVGYSKNKKLA